MKRKKRERMGCNGNRKMAEMPATRSWHVGRIQGQLFMNDLSCLYGSFRGQ